MPRRKKKVPKKPIDDLWQELHINLKDQHPSPLVAFCKTHTAETLAPILQELPVSRQTLFKLVNIAVRQVYRWKPSRYFHVCKRLFGALDMIDEDFVEPEELQSRVKLLLDRLFKNWNMLQRLYVDRGILETQWACQSDEQRAAMVGEAWHAESAMKKAFHGELSWPPNKDEEDAWRCPYLDVEKLIKDDAFLHLLVQRTRCTPDDYLVLDREAMHVARHILFQVREGVLDAEDDDRMNLSVKWPVEIFGRTYKGTICITPERRRIHQTFYHWEGLLLLRSQVYITTGLIAICFRLNPSFVSHGKNIKHRCLLTSTWRRTTSQHRRISILSLCHECSSPQRYLVTYPSIAKCRSF